MLESETRQNFLAAPGEFAGIDFILRCGRALDRDPNRNPRDPKVERFPLTDLKLSRRIIKWMRDVRYPTIALN